MAEAHILILTPDFPPARGGIQVLMHRVAVNLSRLQADVVTLDHAEARSFDEAQPVRIHRIRVAPGPRTAQIAQLNAAAVLSAFRLRPQIVLSGHIVMAPAAAAIRRLLRVPVVQYTYAKELGAKPELARFAMRRANAVIAISRYTADLAQAAGATGRQIRLIPAGVDETPSVRRDPRERPTVVTIARLEDRYKGHDVMIRALGLVRAAVPDVEWVVIGDGPLRASLEDMVGAQGMSGNVRFVGVVSDEERDRWLAGAHAFAMPSRPPAGGFAGEGFGIVYLEAATHGLPVLAGNAGGSLDAVEDGETGLLVDAGDHVAVADGLVELLTHPARAESMGRAGAERAQRFAWPVIAADVERVLSEFLR